MKAKLKRASLLMCCIVFCNGARCHDETSQEMHFLRKIAMGVERYMAENNNELPTSWTEVASTSFLQDWNDVYLKKGGSLAESFRFVPPDVDLLNSKRYRILIVTAKSYSGRRWFVLTSTNHTVEVSYLPEKQFAKALKESGVAFPKSVPLSLPPRSKSELEFEALSPHTLSFSQYGVILSIVVGALLGIAMAIRWLNWRKNRIQ